MVCRGGTKMVPAFRQQFLTTLLSPYCQIASPIVKLHSRTDVYACDVQEKEPCVLFLFFSRAICQKAARSSPAATEAVCCSHRARRRCLSAADRRASVGTLITDLRIKVAGKSRNLVRLNNPSSSAGRTHTKSHRAPALTSLIIPA